MFYGNLDREALEEGKLLNGLKNFLKYKGKKENKEKDVIQYVKVPSLTTDIKIFDLNVILFQSGNRSKKELEEYYKENKDRLTLEAKLINKGKDISHIFKDQSIIEKVSQVDKSLLYILMRDPQIYDYFIDIINNEVENINIDEIVDNYGDIMN